MKKIITIFLLLICVSISFSQSKKKQIETLTYKLDSINSVLLRSIDDNEKLSDTKLVLESKVSLLKNENASKNGEISLLKKENAVKDEEIESLKVYNKSLSTELNLKSDSLKKSFLFHVVGKLESVTSYGEDEEVLSTIFFKYDSKGNLIEKEEIKLGDEKVSVSWKYKYDSKGNKTEEITYEDEKIISSKKFKYDSKGNVIEEISYYSDGTIDDKTKHLYNTLGNLIETIFFYESEVMLSIKYFYDAHGNLAKINEIGGGCDPNIETKIEYNSKGSFKLRIFEGGKYGAKIKLTYDNNGNLIKESWYDEIREFNKSIKYKYDSKGNKIEEITYEDEKIISSKKYKYW